MKVHTIGIDLGKTVFHLIGMDRRRNVVVKKHLSRKQLLTYTANLPACLLGMEACCGAHFLGRALRAQGHDARLISAQFVKPFVKSNKNDYVDAEAIAEAVTRPNMRFVPIKTDDLLAPEQIRSLIHLVEQGSEPAGEARLTAAWIVLWPAIRNFIEQARHSLEEKARQTEEGSAFADLAKPDSQSHSRPADAESRYRAPLLSLLRMPWEHPSLPAAAAVRCALPHRAPVQAEAELAPESQSALWAAVLGSYCCEVALVSCCAAGLVESRRSGFDRLRLRVPLAAAFEQLGLTPDQWSDPELRWLLGWNEWEGHFYLNREAYEQTLGWLRLPALCACAEVAQAELEQDCERMKALGYCVDRVLAAATCEASPAGQSKVVSLRRRQRRKAVERHRKHSKNKHKH